MKLTTKVIIGACLLLCSSQALAQVVAPGQEHGEPPVEGEVAPPPPPTSAVAAPTLDELLAQLASPDATVRVQAAQALGERQVPAAVNPLINVLRTDPVPEVRGWAARSLQQIGSPDAVAAVTQAARQDPDERVRAMAARLAGVQQAPAPAPAPPTAVQQPTPVHTPVVAVPPPPPRRIRIPGRGQRVGGWITTSITYGLAVLVGAGMLSTGNSGYDPEYDLNATRAGWQMMIPIIGPGLALTVNLPDDEKAVAVWGWMWSLGQVAGVTLLIVGYIRKRRHAQSQTALTSPRRGWALAPVGPSGSPGFSLAAWF